MKHYTLQSIALLLLGVLLSSTASGDIGFESRRIFDAGVAPWTLTSGDYNEDGLIDIIVVNLNGNDVSVLLATGSSQFANNGNVAAGSAVGGVTTADFDNDGHLDLAVTNFIGGDNLLLLFGDGTGAFAPAVAIPGGTAPEDVTIGDFNEDGDVDLAIADNIGNAVTILLGDGMGGFGMPTSFPAGAGATSIVAVDFNNDGDLDVATANFGSGDVSVLLGDGTGSLGAALNIPVGATARSLDAADFDENGAIDLVVAIQDGDKATILLGDGTGGFAAPVDFPAGFFAASTSAGDLDGDGHFDFAVANGGSSDITVYRGDGTGGFTLCPPLDPGSGPTPILAVDLNGDAVSDLVVGNFFDDNVDVFFACGQPRPVNELTLYAWEQGVSRPVSIDAMSLGSEAIGAGNPGINVPEIEFGNDLIYAYFNDELRIVDPVTGLITSTLPLNFPPEGNVITAMEFVDDDLYAGLTTAGGGEPTFLSTIDLTTGDVTLVLGQTWPTPLGGLAFDVNSGIMYGISAGGSVGELISIDLISGAGSSIGQVSLPGFGASLFYSALEFDADGTLYTLTADNTVQLRGHLITVDPMTAVATDLGSVCCACRFVALTAPAAAPVDEFLRADVNADGGVNIADSVFLLNALFVPGSPAPSCPDAADINDDGSTNIADAIYLLNALFVPGSPAVPEPSTATGGCGADPTTSDALECPGGQPNC